jgi:hypothetical protein
VEESKGRILIVKFKNITIISAYAPHEGQFYSDEERNLFYEQLSNASKACSRKIPLIICGDFNARVGDAGPIGNTIGNHWFQNRSELNLINGELLTKFAVENKSFLTSTFFKNVSRNNRSTHRGPNGYLSEIDHILYPKRFKHEVIDCKAIGSFRLPHLNKSSVREISDHKLVCLTLKRKRPRHRVLKVNSNIKKPMIWSALDISKVGEFVKNNFINEDNDINDYWELLAKGICDGMKIVQLNNDNFLNQEPDNNIVTDKDTKINYDKVIDQLNQNGEQKNNMNKENFWPTADCY